VSASTTSRKSITRYSRKFATEPVAAGPLSAKLLKNGTLKPYKRFPHGMRTTEADTINATFWRSSKASHASFTGAVSKWPRLAVRS
jgi:hypothetical protein